MITRNTAMISAFEHRRREEEFELCARAIKRGVEPYFLPLTCIEIRETMISLDYFQIFVTLDWAEFKVIPEVEVVSRPGWSNADWMYYIAEQVIKQFWAEPPLPVPDNIILGSD